MREQPRDLHQRIAARVRQLRAARGLTLDALAAQSGVSRSMISLIERGESSPTAVVLEKLATGLGAVLADLFTDPEADRRPAPGGPVARRAAQEAWRDPGSGYVRRNVTPPGAGQPMQVVDVQFPAGARVAFEAGTRDARVFQQVWMLAGDLDITLGEERHRLHAGDCLAMVLDRPVMFFNPTRRPARYAVILAGEPPVRR